MATAAPQAAMQMPQQGASPFADPNAMAVYDQLRQTTSPKAFGDEMLAGAAQADPQAVAKFLQKLQSLNVPPEVLDALNNVVDEILANPERYDELRAKYIAQGLPEKILPAKFDPQFFVALNMAIDQMIAEPAGVQSFAQGGIAELKPIAKAIASYGRNGDTMLAHITPAEARMLRRRGGSGTINPDTGLPEFFLDDFFEGVGDVLGGIGDAVGDVLGGIGDAVQDFVESDVGQIVTTIAIGYFLGPVVATSLSVGTGTIAAAAISGFVGGAGASLLGGGSFEDALKAGAIGGLTAGVTAGVTGASFYEPTAMTPGQAFTNQVDKFTGMISPAQAPLPSPAGAAPAPLGIDTGAPTPAPFRGDFSTVGPGNLNATSVNNPLRGDAVRLTPTPVIPVDTPPAPVSPLRGPDFPQSGNPLATSVSPVNTSVQGPVFDSGSSGVKPAPTMLEKVTNFYDKNISPAGIEKQAIPGAQKAGTDAVKSLLKEFPTASSALQDSTYQAAYKSAMPGVFATYAPITGVGLGALAAFGGFETKPVQSGPITKQLMKPVTQRIAEEGTQRQMYSQGLPGVVYDQYGAPVYGQSVRLPTYDVPDYNSGGYGMPQGQQAMNMPAIYTSPPGTIGSRRVEQPYNTSDMYPNLVPRQYAEGGYAEGGTVTDLYLSNLNRSPGAGELDYWKSQFGDEIDERERALFRDAAAPEIAGVKTEQKAARDAVAQQKALRRSQGSGQMYSNINAGLAALAPETNPMYAGPVADLYRDILRREPDAGGLEFWKSQFGDTVDENERAAFQGAAAPEIVARKNFVGEPAYQTFGAQNRAAGLAGLQTAYAPMLQNQRDAMAKQKAILTGTGSAGAGAAMSAEQPFPMPRFTNAGKQPPDFPGFNDQTRFGMPGGPPPYSMGEGGRGLPPSGYPTRQPSGMPGGFTPMPTPDYPGGGISIQGGTDPYGNLYGSMPYHYGKGPTPNMQSTNMGGIAALAQGGYPRRTGQISGPGTEKSDSIPAMLSDGEFVMTAKAVRGAGKGSRRAGAKKMYALMHQLEKNSERG